MPSNEDEDLRFVIDLASELHDSALDTWFDLELRGRRSTTGQPVITGMTIKPKGDLSWPQQEHPDVIAPVTMRLLRDVARHWDQFEVQFNTAAASGEFAAMVEEIEIERRPDGSTIWGRSGEFTVVTPGGARVPYEPDESEAAYLLREEAGARLTARRRRRTWDGDRLERVATAYRQAQAQGKSVNAAVCNAANVSPTMADKLIKKARDVGLLPRPLTGRKQHR